MGSPTGLGQFEEPLERSLEEEPCGAKDLGRTEHFPVELGLVTAHFPTVSHSGGQLEGSPEGLLEGSGLSKEASSKLQVSTVSHVTAFTEPAATASERSGHFPVELGLATAHGPMRLSHVGRFWALERGLLRTQSEYSLTRDRLH